MEYSSSHGSKQRENVREKEISKENQGKRQSKVCIIKLTRFNSSSLYKFLVSPLNWVRTNAYTHTHTN